MTRVAISTPKNALTAARNRYNRSISVATDDALGGNRGNDVDI
jgi:hypothetical protein